MAATRPAAPPLGRGRMATSSSKPLVNLALNPPRRLGGIARGATAAGREYGARGAVIFRVAPRRRSTREFPSFPQHVPPGDYLLLEVEDAARACRRRCSIRPSTRSSRPRRSARAPAWVCRWCSASSRVTRAFLTIDSDPASRAPALASICRVWRGRRPGPGVRPGAWLPEVLEPEASPGRSILVIDDEEAVLDVVRRTCNRGPPRHRVSSGHEAYRPLAAGRPSTCGSGLDDAA